MHLCRFCYTTFSEDDDDMYDTCAYKRFQYHMMRCQETSQTGVEDEDDVVTYIRHNGDHKTHGVAFEEILDFGRREGKSWANERALDWIIDVFLRRQVVVEMEVPDKTSFSGFRGDYFRFWYKMWIPQYRYAVDECLIYERDEGEEDERKNLQLEAVEDQGGAGAEAEAEDEDEDAFRLGKEGTQSIKGTFDNDVPLICFAKQEAQAGTQSSEDSFNDDITLIDFAKQAAQGGVDALTLGKEGTQSSEDSFDDDIPLIRLLEHAAQRKEDTMDEDEDSIDSLEELIRKNKEYLETINALARKLQSP